MSARYGLGFNGSEYRGYKYGESLKLYANNLKGRLPGYTMNVFAYSHGAAILGAALDSDLNLSNCALVSAALPSGAFTWSASINNYQPFLDIEQNGGPFQVTPDVHSELGYRGFLERSVSGVNIKGGVVSGSITNFFNAQDYFLQTGLLSWKNNELTEKPEISALGNWLYWFDPLATHAQQCRITDGSISASVKHYVTDPHESMAFLARPRSQALGAQAGVSGTITNNIDLGAAPFSLGSTADDHIFAYGFQVQKVIRFFGALLEEFKIDPVEP